MRFIFTIVNQSRLYGEYISQASADDWWTAWTQRYCPSLCFIPGRARTLGLRSDEDPGPGTPRNARAGWAQHWVMSGIRKISWFLEKYFVCKMKIWADCSQMSDPPGFVDASREKLPRTFDIFTVCNSGVCKRRQKPVGDVRKPQTWNMNCLHRNQNLTEVRENGLKKLSIILQFYKASRSCLFHKAKSNYHSLLGIFLY